MKKSVLVTGGMGFIGSHLVSKLLENYTVYVVDDFSNSVVEPSERFDVPQRNVIAPMVPFYDFEKDPRNPKLIVVEADFTHQSILTMIEDGKFEYVFHLAAQPRVEWSVENPLLATDENFAKTIELAKSSAEGNTKFIFSSTAAVYGNSELLPTVETDTTNPLSPYGLSKLCAENYLGLFESLYGLEWVALRYFNVYGPGQPGDSPYSTAVSAWCHKAKNKEPLRSDGDGSQTRDMIHVYDVVDANIHVAHMDKSDQTIFNVGSGEAVSNNYILSIFSSRGYNEVVQAPERPGDVKHTLSSIKSLQNTGWSPKIKFKEGIQSVLDHWEL